jgi:polar amino acid transport system substrate-binding protein
VGTLKASLAERILQDKGGIDIRAYEAESNAYPDLENGRIDAVLLDAPIAIYLGKPNPKLKVLPEPIGSMTYGIAIRKSNSKLHQQVNSVLIAMKKDGTLKKLYQSWGLWNSAKEDSFYPTAENQAIQVKDTKFQEYLALMGLERTWKDQFWQYVGFLPVLGKGALVTLWISVTSMILAILLGLTLAVIRLYGPKIFSVMATLYIEIVRGTPLLIQLYFIFYGLPNLGIKLSPFVAAFLGLGLNYAAYQAENYRAGIQSISKGQYEASTALGLSRMQTLFHIILPQSLRLVIPPVTNDFISLLKDSSLVSVITLVELTKVYGQLATTHYDYFGIGVMVAAFYFLIGLPFVRLARWAEKRLQKERPSLYA